MVKSFWSSSTDHYSVKHPNLLIGKVGRSNKLEFKVRCDLANYAVTLGKDNEKFNLVPKDDKFGLQKLEFVAENEAERNKWYKALTAN